MRSDSLGKRKTVLIIADPRENLSLVTRDLIGRGVKVEVRTELKSALQAMLEIQPDVILIPVDHFDKRVQVLPKVLKKSDELKMVAYATSKSALTIRALKNSGVPHIIYPPLSSTLILKWIETLAPGAILTPPEPSAKTTETSKSLSESKAAEVETSESREWEINCIRVCTNEGAGFLFQIKENRRELDEAFNKLMELKNWSTNSLKEIQYLSFTTKADITKLENDSSAIRIDETHFFLPMNKSFSSLTQSTNPNLLAFKLADLKVDEPLRFDLYVQLPFSGSTFLLKPRGHSLYQRQKEKLLHRGIKNGLVQLEQQNRFYEQNAEQALKSL